MRGDIGFCRVLRIGPGDPVFGDEFGEFTTKPLSGEHLPPPPPQGQPQIEQQLAIPVGPAKRLALHPHFQRLGIVEGLQGMCACAKLLEGRLFDVDARLRRAARILADEFADLPLPRQVPQGIAHLGANRLFEILRARPPFEPVPAPDRGQLLSCETIGQRHRRIERDLRALVIDDEWIAFGHQVISSASTRA